MNTARKVLVLKSFIPLEEFAYNEQRYKILQKNNPVEAALLMKLAQESLDLHWHTYEYMAHQEPAEFQPMS